MTLPAGFPLNVAAFACDLDGTIVGGDGLLSPRTRAAIARSRAAGITVLVATGRMFRSVRPYVIEAGITDPVICYQGAAVVDPGTGTFLVHQPIELALAHEAIAALEAAGHSPNVYVDDRLYVASHNPHGRDYAAYQRLDVTEIDDLAAWLTVPPTKLVAVGDPAVLRALRDVLRSQFDGRLFVTTSLPTLLELGHRSVSKGTGLAFVADRLGLDVGRIVAFGDGENDIELLETAGFGIAIEGGHEALLAIADGTCAGPESHGVANTIETALDLLA